MFTYSGQNLLNIQFVCSYCGLKAVNCLLHTLGQRCPVNLAKGGLQGAAINARRAGKCCWLKGNLTGACGYGCFNSGHNFSHRGGSATQVIYLGTLAWGTGCTNKYSGGIVGKLKNNASTEVNMVFASNRSSYHCLSWR